MSVTAIIQARMDSTRLPQKVLLPLAGRPVLSWVARAAQLSGVCDHVVVATTEQPADDVIVKFCAEEGLACIRGSEDDVLDRFVTALDTYPAETVVRLTADCPMVDPGVIAQAVSAFQAVSDSVDYLSTVLTRSLPHGLDVEVVSAQTLRIIHHVAKGVHRVHVTSAIYTNPHLYRVAGLVFSPDCSDLRITIDTPSDAELISAIADEIGDRPPSWRELVALLQSRPELRALNAKVQQKALEEG